MKLVDILARELTAWPETTRLAQDSNGHVFGWTGFPNWDGDQWIIDVGASLDKCRPGEMDLADDHMTASVTRAEWQVAVDALNAPKVVEWEQGDIPPIGEACEAYVLADTEKQGRQMNRWISGKFIGKALSDNGGIILLVECEDGWAHAINAFSYVRPIRTAEQVASEEREKAIKDLYYTINWNDEPKYWDDGVSAARKADYAKAIDAGYTKVAK